MQHPHLTNRLLLAVMALSAVLLALVIVVLPPKVAGVVAIVGIGVIGMVIAVLLPDVGHDRSRTVMALLILAVASKLLWPNFAYIPVPGLPFKNPQRWIWLFCTCYWVYALLTTSALRERLAHRATRHPLSWLVFAFFAWRLVSCVGSTLPGVSLFLVATELFDFLPAYLFAITWIRDEDDVARLGHAIVLVMLGIELLALLETALKTNPFVSLVPQDTSNEDFLRTAVSSKFREGGYRAQATFNHPLLLAQFLVFALPLALGAWRSGASASRRRSRVFATMALLLLPAALWSTHTRTAVVSGVAGAILLGLALAWQAVRAPGKRFAQQVAGYFGLIVMAAGLLATAGLAQVLATGRSAIEVSSTQSRLTMLDLALRSAGEAPLLGHGPLVGTFTAALRSSDGTVSLDSYFLTQLVESGWPGLLLYTAFGLAALWLYLRVASGSPKVHPPASLDWSLALVTFVLTTTVLSTAHNMPLLYLALGVMVALTPARTRRAVAGSSP